MNYTRFLNKLSSGREPSALRLLTAIQAQAEPGLISLAVGMPNPNMFPFQDATIALRDGRKITISEKKMKTALQYAPTPGVPSLKKQLTEMQLKIHKPPYEPELLVTTGSQDGMCKAFEMVMDPQSYVLLEEPSYPGLLGLLRPYNPRYLTLEGDKDGIKPESLQKVLSPWKPSDEETDVDMPKVLYVIPNGGNPTGTSITLDRKKQIYKIAQNYNLLIFEDDPYYFLQFAKEPVPSFLSMDVDGRVLRFDSFSKVLSAGLRLGFVTGPATLIKRIELHMQVSSLHTSALSQVIVSQLLSDIGFDGFMQHVEKVKEFYRNQKEKMNKVAEKHLKGLAEWNEPTGGMFMWIRCHGIADSSAMISERALEKQVLLAQGAAFMTDKKKLSPYVRASYSLASEDEMDKGFQRLAELIKEEQASQ